MILPGEPFGEIHSLCNVHRTTDLVAMEDSKALLLPADFLTHVSRGNSQLELKLTRRLLKTVTLRFANFANMAVYTVESSKSRLHIQTPALAHPTVSNEISHKVNSYRFDSLGDQEGEFKRLITQASIGEDIEFAALENLGLRDGTKILDLGSGPGVTSLLMAKRFPSAKITGVEPDDTLRKKADMLISSKTSQAVVAL